MLTVARSLVMWLIALAIPVQGMAAVATPPCPPAHHSHGSPSPHRHVGHHDAASPAAQAVDHATDHGAGPAQHVASAPDETGHAGHSMLECCSAAGAMYGVMPPSFAAWVPACSRPPQAVEPLRLGIAPDGLDRPPKPNLA